MTTTTDQPPRTGRAAMAAHLRSLGWVRLNGARDQLWQHPTRPGSWTLATAWRHATAAGAPR